MFSFTNVCSVVDYNQHNASLRQWSSGYLPNSKPQAVSGTSDQVSDGRKKRHLSETAIGKAKLGIYKTAVHSEKTHSYFLSEDALYSFSHK